MAGMINYIFDLGFNWAKLNLVAFDVLIAVSMKMAVFWVAAPCSVVEIYCCFRGACCLHHQGDQAPLKCR
jgi:hypothetical protein